jgi:membrane fusion protein, copper/silver efflux system
MENPTRERLGVLKTLVSAIDPAQFQDDELARWNEFSRRLLNDFAAASQIIDSHPAQAAAQVARGVELAGRFLGLPYQPARSTFDPATAATLREVIAAYLPVSKALADDDDEAAKQAAVKLAAAADGDLRPLADAVTAAPEIKSRRAAFQPLSDRLIALIREHGTDAVGNAYVVHCPMAFGNTGGDWISAKPEVLNPYFGDRMLTCGTVTDTLSIDSSDHTDH